MKNKSLSAVLLLIFAISTVAVTAEAYARGCGGGSGGSTTPLSDYEKQSNLRFFSLL